MQSFVMGARLQEEACLDVDLGAQLVEYESGCSEVSHRDFVDPVPIDMQTRRSVEPQLRKLRRYLRKKPSPYTFGTPRFVAQRVRPIEHHARSVCFLAEWRFLNKKRKFSVT